MKRQGDLIVMQRDELLAVKWKDRRVVTLLSMADCPTAKLPVKRRTRDGSQHMVPSHALVTDCNANMNGVDHADQMRNAYPISGNQENGGITSSGLHGICLQCFHFDEREWKSSAPKRKRKSQRKDPAFVPHNLAKLLIGSF